MTNRESELELWFERAPQEQLEILREFRARILEFEGVVEDFKWSRPCYSNKKGLFAYLNSTKNYAQLGFHFGSELLDSGGLLEGSGKRMRHIKARSIELARDQRVLELLKRAYER